MAYSKKLAVFSKLEFDEIEVGLERKLNHTISQKDVDDFAELTGDFNPVHVDPEYAAQTSFGKNVVHGMLTSSFISTMIGMMIPGPGALWTSQKLEFLNPTFVGDQITVTAIVKQKSAATRMLVLEISITNQKGVKVVAGESSVKVLEEKKNEKKGEIVEQITLVTGGSGGIGAAIAKELANQGHIVIVNYLRSEEKASSLVEEIKTAGGKAAALRGDVSKLADVQSIFQSTTQLFGPIVNVVHCAAPHPIPKPLEELDWEIFDGQWSSQIHGAFNCIKCALPLMKEKKTGSFIFIGSIFTEGIPPAQQAPYIAAKAALVALAKSLAVEIGPHGIRSNVIAPGMTHTEMISNIPDKIKLVAKMNTPLRRLGDPDDVAGVAAFLLSSKARHITGEVIKVCGGLVM